MTDFVMGVISFCVVASTLYVAWYYFCRISGDPAWSDKAKLKVHIAEAGLLLFFICTESNEIVLLVCEALFVARVYGLVYTKKKGPTNKETVDL